MIQWIKIILCFLVLLFSTPAVSGKSSTNCNNLTQLIFGATQQPTVYVSPEPNLCANFSDLVFWVYVHSPDNSNLNYVSFDLDIYFFMPSVPFVSPENGVVLGTYDVSKSPYHLEAAWTTRSLEHEPIIKLRYLTDPGFSATPKNVVFRAIGGASVSGYGMESFSCCLDCFPCSADIFAQDHAYVIIGEKTVIPFKWSWGCYTTGGGPLTASDTEGWVSAWAPPSIGDYGTCGLCFLPTYDGWVEISVPEGTPVGTISQLAIIGANGGKLITLEADDGSPIFITTWGKIKSLFR